MKSKLFGQKRFHLLCLWMALLLGACGLQTALPPENSTPMALTPRTPAAVGQADDARVQQPLPTELAEDVGDAPILLTPAALQTANTPVSPATQINPSTPVSSSDAVLLTPIADTPAAVSAPLPNAPESAPTAQFDKNASQSEPTPDASVCGRSDAITLLILGIDQNAQADAIRLARIDFSKPEINLVSIPRDFFVPVVGFEPFGIEKGRINATFGYGEYFFGAGTGAEWLAKNLTYNFGVEIDHRFALRLEDISRYIDAVGGVEVVLDAPASDGSSSFPAGVNAFDGERAVTFMRMRMHDSDFRRIDRQTMVLNALLDKVRGGLSPMKILSLLSVMLRDVLAQSGLSLRDLQSFYCLSKQISMEDIHVREIPAEMFHTYTTPNGGWVLIPHAEVADFIKEALNH